MEGIKRRRLGERAWRELVGRFKQSGETVSAFCGREGLRTNTFYRWQARLAKPSASRPSIAPRPTKLQAPSPGFVDLGALRAAPPGAGRLELKLDLGAGVVLHVVRG